MRFAAWLDEMQRALDGVGETSVSCDGCTACCTSSQFVHIDPDERDALAHIPSELLFPAPGEADGHVLLGYDDNGCCPMLRDGGCSIYEHRPRACRVYDCRIFTATGFVPDDKPAVAERSRGWVFEVNDDEDIAARQAVADAAAGIRSEAQARSATEAAVVTIRAVSRER